MTYRVAVDFTSSAYRKQTGRLCGTCHRHLLLSRSATPEVAFFWEVDLNPVPGQLVFYAPAFYLAAKRLYHTLEVVFEFADSETGGIHQL